MQIHRSDNICHACAERLGAKPWPRECDNIAGHFKGQCIACCEEKTVCGVRDHYWPNGLPQVGARIVCLCTECAKQCDVGETINPSDLCQKCQAAWYAKFPEESGNSHQEAATLPELLAASLSLIGGATGGKT